MEPWEDLPVKIKVEPESEQFEERRPKQKGPNRPVLNCSECDYTTVSRSQFVAHSVKHTGEFPFKCEKCNKKFTANASLKRHLEETHEGIRSFECLICHKLFYNAGGLRAHSVTHTKQKPFKCKECGKTFSMSSNLSRHKRIHTNAKPYKCELCDASFTDYASHRYHMLRHSGEKPYQCHQCSKQFFTSSDLRRHSSKHSDDRPFDCSVCGMTFKTKGHLVKHSEVHNTKRTVWKCKYCGKKLTTKASWLNHEKVVHEGAKPYQCPICEKRFTSKMYLLGHRVIHTEEKPFPCGMCEKTFSHRSNMKRHERMHSSRMRYSCKYCKKGFKYVNSWKYHERAVHRNKILHTCDTCGFKFKSTKGWEGHQCRGFRTEDVQEPTNADIQHLTEAGISVCYDAANNQKQQSGSKGTSAIYKVLQSKKDSSQGLIMKISKISMNEGRSKTKAVVGKPVSMKPSQKLIKKAVWRSNKSGGGKHVEKHQNIKTSKSKAQNVGKSKTDKTSPMAIAEFQVKRKRGRPKIIRNSEHNHLQVEHLKNSISSRVYQPGTNSCSTANAEGSVKRKRGRPKKIADNILIGKTPITEHENFELGQARSISDWMIKEEHFNSLNINPNAVTTSATAVEAIGKRKRGRPKKIPDKILIGKSPTTQQMSGAFGELGVSNSASMNFERHQSRSPLGFELKKDLFNSLNLNPNGLITTMAVGEETSKRKRGRPKKIKDRVLIGRAPTTGQMSDACGLQEVNSDYRNIELSPSRTASEREIKEEHFNSLSLSPIVVAAPVPVVEMKGKRKRGRPKKIPDRILIGRAPTNEQMLGDGDIQVSNFYSMNVEPNQLRSLSQLEMKREHVSLSNLNPYAEVSALRITQVTGKRKRGRPKKMRDTTMIGTTPMTEQFLGSYGLQLNYGSSQLNQNRSFSEERSSENHLNGFKKDPKAAKKQKYRYPCATKRHKRRKQSVILNVPRLSKTVDKEQHVLGIHIKSEPVSLQFFEELKNGSSECMEDQSGHLVGVEQSEYEESQQSLNAFPHIPESPLEVGILPISNVETHHFPERRSESLPSHGMRVAVIEPEESEKTHTFQSPTSCEFGILPSHGTVSLPSHGTVSLPSHGTVSLPSHGTVSLPSHGTDEQLGCLPGDAEIEAEELQQSLTTPSRTSETLCNIGSQPVSNIESEGFLEQNTMLLPSENVLNCLEEMNSDGAHGNIEENNVMEGHLCFVQTNELDDVSNIESEGFLEQNTMLLPSENVLNCLEEMNSDGAHGNIEENNVMEGHSSLVQTNELDDGPYYGSYQQGDGDTGPCLAIENVCSLKNM